MFQFINSDLFFFLFDDPMAFHRLISFKRSSLMNISSKMLNVCFALKSIITRKYCHSTENQNPAHQIQLSSAGNNSLQAQISLLVHESISLYKLMY